MNKTQTFSKKAHETRQRVEDALSFSRVDYTVDLFKNDVPDASEYIYVKHPSDTHIACVIIEEALKVVNRGFVDVIDGKAVLVLVVD